MTRKETVMAGVSIALAVMAAEGAARLLLKPYRICDRHSTEEAVPKHVPDAELGWKILPRDASYRLHMLIPKGAEDVSYTIENGYRATSAHPAAGPEVIAAGCSFTFGLGLNDEDTWPWLLQQRLPDYHVINTGTNGYGTDQALLAADRVMQHSAEPARLVLLGFADFQIERNRSTQAILQWPYPSGKPLFLPHGAGVESAGLVRFWYPGSVLDHSVLFMAVANRVGNLMNRIPSHEGAREATARLMVEYAHRFQTRGARLAVIVLPHAHDWVRESKADQKFIVDRLQAAGVPVLVPEFPRLDRGRLDRARFLIAADQVHPNRDYNVLLSGQLAKFIASERLLAP